MAWVYYTEYRRRTIHKNNYGIYKKDNGYRRRKEQNNNHNNEWYINTIMVQYMVSNVAMKKAQ